MARRTVAVLSGKGGTGKTLVSVNLAAAAQNALYIDCDVEEPNGHLYWKPELVQTQEVSRLIPAVNPALCNGCRTCVDFCAYNAIAYIGNSIKVFADVCHSCGGCALLCPQNALHEEPRRVGEVQNGISGGVRTFTGILDTGQASGVSIIQTLLQQTAQEQGPIFIDCPPGSACVVMESIQDADYCVLVAEPTLFGAHNLAMVHRLATLFHKKCGAVLNKCQQGRNPSEEYCTQQGIPILARIPYDEALGRMNSGGGIAVRQSEEYRRLFTGLLHTIEKEAQA